MGIVYLVKMTGLTSNNFFQHVFFDSFCREHNIMFVNPFLQKFYADYPNLNEHKRSKNVDQWAMISIWIRRKLGLIKVVHFKDISMSQSYFSLVLKSEKLYCKGWYFRNFELIEKYRHVYKHLFAPDVNEPDLERNFLNKSHNKQKILGIHIRRGDYKTFQGGINYFEDEVYIRKIQELITDLNEDYKIIIFTNDKKLNKEVYCEHFADVTVSKNSVKVDHYLMSKCDYIMGPESTFSLWASYIGDVPYYHIKDTNTIVTLDKFRVFSWV